MINTTDYAHKIVQNLEAQGYTKDMVIGYLQGTINGFKYLYNEEVNKYLDRTVRDTQPKQ